MRLNVKSRDIFHRYQVCFLERERSNRSTARDTLAKALFITRIDSLFIREICKL